MLIISYSFCTAICVFSLYIPGYVRAGPWHAAFLVLTAATIGATLALTLLRRVTPAIETVVLYGADLAILVGLVGLNDHGGARVGALLLVLPTTFFALFQGVRMLIPQAGVVLVAGTTLMWLGGDRSALLVIHTGMVVLSALLPSGSIQVVRWQLGSARAREQVAAVTDPLTGLENRRGLTDRFERALSASRRDGAMTGLLLIDRDRFKEVNDALGHDRGDDLLRRIGPRLKTVLRPNDTVARLGGDEFSVLLPVIDGVSSAVAIAMRLREALDEPFTLEGVELETEASVGVVVSGVHGDDVTTLLRRADVAMYVAKGRGLGVFAYDFGSDQHSPQRLALIGQLRRGMDRGELVLYYQPKISLSTGKLVGAEALVRWRHPEHGMVPPDDFIPMAETTGLISPLTRYVLDAALAQSGVFAAAGLAVPLAVNLSARNLLEPGLYDQVSELLSRHAVPAHLLELEVTESAIMLDPVRALRMLSQLRELGVGIAIDDFGAGYTSLAQLNSMPVTELKVDRSFVMAMDTHPNDALIVRSIVDLGHSLGLTTVAEGVETQQAMTALADYGCDVAQGYLLSRPLPADDFLGWCSDRVMSAIAELPLGAGSSCPAGTEK